MSINLGALPDGRYFDGTYEWDKEGTDWTPLRAPSGMPTRPELADLRRVVTTHEPLEPVDEPPSLTITGRVSAYATHQADALAPLLAEAWEAGASAAWDSSGEGRNGEYPDGAKHGITNPYRQEPTGGYSEGHRARVMDVRRAGGEMLAEVQAAIGNALEGLLTELGLDPNDYPSDDGHYRESYGATLYRAATDAVLPVIGRERAKALLDYAAAVRENDPNVEWSLPMVADDVEKWVAENMHTHRTETSLRDMVLSLADECAAVAQTTVRNDEWRDAHAMMAATLRDVVKKNGSQAETASIGQGKASEVTGRAVSPTIRKIADSSPDTTRSCTPIAPSVWQVVEAVDYEPDQEIATFADEAAANRLAERLREHFRETPVREVAVRRFPIVADPDAVEVMTYWSLSGPVTKEPEGPWPTVLVEGLDSETQFAQARPYTAGVVVAEEDADETWRGRGTVHYISVDGPTSEAVRDAWNAARDAYLARG